MKTKMNLLDVPTPIGVARLCADAKAIRSIQWADRVSHKSCANPILLKAGKQLREYFTGNRRKFKIPLAPEGTDFQKLIWKLCVRIPYGSTVTYGDLARRSKHSGAARAVGSVMAANPIPLIIPCHRVLGVSGLGGYSGNGGLDTKRFLLDLEQHVKQGRSNAR